MIAGRSVRPLMASREVETRRISDGGWRMWETRPESLAHPKSAIRNPRPNGSPTLFYRNEFLDPRVGWTDFRDIQISLGVQGHAFDKIELAGLMSLVTD